LNMTTPLDEAQHEIACLKAEVAALRRINASNAAARPDTGLAGELDSAVELMGEALFKFSWRMNMAGVFASGSALTDANAASYERVVAAWGKLTSAIARATPLPTWDHYAEEPVDSDMVPRDVAESWKAKAENYAVERANFLADFADMMANHVENWPTPKRLKTVVALIDKTLSAALRQPASDPGDVERVAVALWRNDAERAAPNVAKGRTLEAFAEQSEDTRLAWIGAAKAAIAALQVKP
jgi:hypothetical protein